ncbi:MAG: CYTH domain-containing protein [FCB group bacterium]|nr:CYTH domain-containing protein [FCB group bacterium]
MKEIERKFLVIRAEYRNGILPVRYRQGYIMQDATGHLRIRVGGGKAILGFKKLISGFSRWEFEYPVPVDDAEEMLAHLCEGRVVEKDRYTLTYRGMRWEVDEFLGKNAGLVIAEIELDSEGRYFEKPPWAGEEVTHDPRYLNVHLAEHPYGEW